MDDGKEDLFELEVTHGLFLLREVVIEALVEGIVGEIDQGSYFVKVDVNLFLFEEVWPIDRALEDWREFLVFRERAPNVASLYPFNERFNALAEVAWSNPIILCDSLALYIFIRCYCPTFSVIKEDLVLIFSISAEL